MIAGILAVHLIRLLGARGNSASETNVTVSSMLDGIFKGYDKRLPPKYSHTGFREQVVVSVNMYILSMFSVSETDMDYSMSMFLRERWKDERLAYDNILNLTRLELDNSSMDKVWMPDMFILNEKLSHVHEVTVPNRMVHVYADGTVQFSMRVTGSFFCLMHLHKFPFDTQDCRFEVESYGFSTENQKFVWSENPVTVKPGIHLAQFSLKQTITYNCDKAYYGIAYPCIGVKFVLARNYGYYIIQIYVPSILIVFLSWVNFWLDPTSSPARVSLGLLTVLTMTTQSSGARANLPHVSYIKGIDVWMSVCLSFVFLAFVEFAYVSVQSRVISRKRTVSVENEHTSGRSATVSEITVRMEQETHIPCFNKLTRIDRARLIDKLSRVIFPVTFLLFNVVYWLVYFLWDPEIDKEEL